LTPSGPKFRKTRTPSSPRPATSHPHAPAVRRADPPPAPLGGHDFGFKIILWDVDPLDWRNPGPSVVAQRIIAGTHPVPSSFHDIHSGTVDAMPQVFDTLLAKGLQFVTVSNFSPWIKARSPKETRRPNAGGAVPAATP